MQPHAASRMAMRITAAAGAIIAIVGLILVFGARPTQSGLAGIGTAVQTIVGGALLVAAALVGLTSAALWLLAARKARRLRPHRARR